MKTYQSIPSIHYQPPKDQPTTLMMKLLAVSCFSKDQTIFT